LVVEYFFKKTFTSKLCILTYYYKEIHIASQEFESTVYEGVLALLDLEYFIKRFVHANHPKYESTGIFVIRGENMGGGKQIFVVLSMS
jgi:hypothetical protein